MPVDSGGFKCLNRLDIAVTSWPMIPESMMLGAAGVRPRSSDVSAHPPQWLCYGGWKTSRGGLNGAHTGKVLETIEHAATLRLGFAMYVMSVLTPKAAGARPF